MKTLIFVVSFFILWGDRDCCSVTLSESACILVSSKNNREIYFDFNVSCVNRRFSIAQIIKNVKVNMLNSACHSVYNR